MKRMIGALLAAALALLCAGCGEARSGETAYALYFQEAEAEMGSGALRAETAYLPQESGSVEETAAALMEALLQGPLDMTLKSPIPAGTSLLELRVEGGRAYVDVSAAYASLSGVALTLADYAVALTLTQIPEIGSVRITVRGQELAYRDKQTFTSRDVLLTAEEDVVGTVAAVLYFPDSDGTLCGEERTLDLYEGDTQVFAVVRALENGPVSKRLSAALPEGFRVRSVWQEEGVCYVNLASSQLETLPPDTELSPAIRAITQSLRSLDSVEEIRFLVDGVFAKTYGTVDISGAYC